MKKFLEALHEAVPRCAYRVGALTSRWAIASVPIIIVLLSYESLKIRWAAGDWVLFAVDAAIFCCMLRLAGAVVAAPVSKYESKETSEGKP